MKILIRLLLVSILIFSFCQLYSCYSSDDVKDTYESTNEIPSEYLRLLKLNDSCCNKPNDNIAFIDTWKWKYRNPVSFFSVSGKYYLQLYKIDTAFNYPLKNAIKEVYSDAHSWIYTPYGLDERTKMEFLYKLTKPTKPRIIYLDLYGDDTQVLTKNDTIVYYYTKCVSFSIKYDLQKPNDIYGESHSESSSEIPLEIMFFKRKNNLYMSILSAKGDEIKIIPGTLHNLLFR